MLQSDYISCQFCGEPILTQWIIGGGMLLAAAA
jgi:hypothetical protein